MALDLKLVAIAFQSLAIAVLVIGIVKNHRAIKAVEKRIRALEYFEAKRGA